MGEVIDDLECRELVELVTEYLDDALPADLRARFEAHLADCEGCEAFLAQMRTTIRLTRAAGAFADRPDLAPLLEALRRQLTASPSPRTTSQRPPNSDTS